MLLTWSAKTAVLRYELHPVCFVLPLPTCTPLDTAGRPSHWCTRFGAIDVSLGAAAGTMHPPAAENGCATTFTG